MIPESLALHYRYHATQGTKPRPVYMLVNIVDASRQPAGEAWATRRKTMLAAVHKQWNPEKWRVVRVTMEVQ